MGAAVTIIGCLHAIKLVLDMDEYLAVVLRTLLKSLHAIELLR